MRKYFRYWALTNQVSTWNDVFRDREVHDTRATTRQREENQTIVFTSHTQRQLFKISLSPKNSSSVPMLESSSNWLNWQELAPAKGPLEMWRFVQRKPTVSLLAKVGETWVCIASLYLGSALLCPLGVVTKLLVLSFEAHYENQSMAWEIGFSERSSSSKVKILCL